MACIDKYGLFDFDGDGETTLEEECLGMNIIMGKHLENDVDTDDFDDSDDFDDDFGDSDDF